MEKFLILSYVASQDGNIKETHTIDNKFIMKGEKTGALVEKKSDGTINYVEMDFKTQEGITKNYHDNGNIQFAFEQINGIKNGLFQQYYPEGGIYIQCVFKNNIKNGDEIHFNRNGTVKQLIPYVNGLVHGTVASFFSNEKIEHERYFDNGNLTFAKYYQYDTDSEILYTEYRCKNGKYNGKAKEYYKNGICASESYYVDGKLNGKYVRYDMKGRIHSEGNYVDDNKIGEFRYYDTRGTLTHTKKFS